MAATGQNAGKTTTALGLFSLLEKWIPPIGYLKPVAQRVTTIEGAPIDEDSVLMHRTFGTAGAFASANPVGILPNFTRNFLDGDTAPDFSAILSEAFEQAAVGNRFLILEGSGHAGVGSVFGLSNARVAKLLASKVLLVVPAGIGRPVDEAAVNKALFDSEGVEIFGVVMNKVDPDRIEEIGAYAAKGFARIGLELLAVLPSIPSLAEPTLREIRTLIRGEPIGVPKDSADHVARVVVGTMTSAHLLERLSPRSLLLLSGDREDLILAAIAEANAGTAISGVVLTDGLLPHTRIIELLKESGISAIRSPLDAYSIASRIHSMTVKTLPGDQSKIDTIRKLFLEYFPDEKFRRRTGLLGE